MSRAGGPHPPPAQRAVIGLTRQWLAGPGDSRGAGQLAVPGYRYRRAVPGWMRAAGSTAAATARLMAA
jgi:hypothetical protein